MTNIKCITFDKAAQDALPDHIKAKMKADRENARLEKVARDRAIYIERLAKEYVEQLTSNFAESEETIEHVQRVFMAGAKLLQPEIDSLKAEIDELIEALEEATRWISVNEGLPEVGATVLIKVGDSNKFVSTAHFAHERFIIDFYDMRDDEPTHWRPIDTPKATQLLEEYGKK